MSANRTACMSACVCKHACSGWQDGHDRAASAKNRLDRWLDDGWLDDGWLNGWMAGWMDGWMDGRMDGWMDGLMDERMDERMKGCRQKGGQVDE